jgi:hypothetical protein
MGAKRVDIMTIRPANSQLIVDLMDLAQKDSNRSLNNYVVMVLENHVKKKKLNGKKVSA